MKAVAIMKGNFITCGDLYIKKNKLFFDSNDVIIKSFKDIKNFKKYKRFEDNKELFGISLNKKDIKKLMKEIGIKDLYFYDDHSIISNKTEFKKYWFEYINIKCINCINKCKQSSRVKILYCKDFKGK
jgi:hypothetical protein